MTSDFVVRSACPRDLASIIALCAEHAAYERASFNPTGKPEALALVLFTAVPRLYAWVVECSGAVVGYATASREFSTWRGDEYLHLDCLYLRESYRGCGAGRILMGKIARAAIAMNLTEVQWQTPDWNTAAIRVYERLGAIGREKRRYALSGPDLERLAVPQDEIPANHCSVSPKTI